MFNKYFHNQCSIQSIYKKQNNISSIHDIDDLILVQCHIENKEQNEYYNRSFHFVSCHILFLMCFDFGEENDSLVVLNYVLNLLTKFNYQCLNIYSLFSISHTSYVTNSNTTLIPYPFCSIHKINNKIYDINFYRKTW